MKIEVYKSGGQWYWRVRAANGNVLADSSEGYKNLSDCKSMARKVTRRFLVVVIK